MTCIVFVIITTEVLMHTASLKVNASLSRSLSHTHAFVLHTLCTLPAIYRLKYDPCTDKCHRAIYLGVLKVG